MNAVLTQSAKGREINMMETPSVESKIGELTNYSIRPLVKLSVDDLVFVGTLCKYRHFEFSVFEMSSPFIFQPP